MSESKTPTPRTDEQLTSSHWNTYCLNDREGTEYVPAAFARTLELEFNEANKSRLAWASSYGTICGEADELRSKLTTAQQEIAELRSLFLEVKEFNNTVIDYANGNLKVPWINVREDLAALSSKIDSTTKGTKE